MGRKLWVLLGISLAALGMVRCLPDGRTSSAQHLPSFSPGSVQIQPTLEGEVSAKETGLPCALEDGGLVAEELVEYEGPYLEDGSNEPVSGVAALMLYNAGPRGISSGAVAVRQGNRTLYFYVTWLPAGARALVLAFDREAYSTEPVAACKSVAVRWENFQTEQTAIRLGDDNGLEIINRSGGELREICLRCKPYVTDGDFYLGGITRSIYIPHLAPGESRRVETVEYGDGVTGVVAVLHETK